MLMIMIIASTHPEKGYSLAGSFFALFISIDPVHRVFSLCIAVLIY
jgi:hypothetical protein